ncbi:guanine nucleotide-binding protein subunit beta-5a-like [Rhopilema esculentum]|uniref:guanine nucleotide-binding protein subunit beta-5a-like n=1 Tax=Rhopilema esculentum TaxID=499914 RepID=UPI0031E032DB
MASEPLAPIKRERAESGGDMLASLTKEAQHLKSKLEEEKRKLYDADLESVSLTMPSLQPLQLKARRTLKGHQTKVLALDWASDGQHLVSSSQDGKIIIWDAYTTNKEDMIVTNSSWVMALAYSPSQKFTACGGLDNRCTIYNVSLIENENSEPKHVATHASHVTCCSFTKSDHQILTGSGDTTCALWDVESATMIRAFKGHTADVLSLHFSSKIGGAIFVSAGCDETVRVWDIRTGQCVQSFEGHQADINCVRFFPSGEGVASASDDSTCRLYDLRADREMAVYAKDSILFGATSIDFSASGRLMFAGYNDYLVRVWDTLKISEASILYGHENRVSTLQVSPDGTAIATGSWDNNIKVWA